MTDAEQLKYWEAMVQLIPVVTLAFVIVVRRMTGLLSEQVSAPLRAFMATYLGATTLALALCEMAGLYAIAGKLPPEGFVEMSRQAVGAAFFLLVTEPTIEVLGRGFPGLFARLMQTPLVAARARYRSRKLYRRTILSHRRVKRLFLDAQEHRLRLAALRARADGLTSNDDADFLEEWLPEVRSLEQESVATERRIDRLIVDHVDMLERYAVFKTLIPHSSSMDLARRRRMWLPEKSEAVSVDHLFA